MKVDFCMHGIFCHDRFNDLDFDERSQWLGRGFFFSIELSRQLSKQIKIKLSATVGHDKFYFNPKVSVAFILNYGHTDIFCKTCVCNLVIEIACFLPNVLSAA